MLQQLEGQQHQQQQHSVETTEVICSNSDSGINNTVHSESPSVIHQLQPQPQPVIYTDSLQPASSVPCYQQQQYTLGSSTSTAITHTLVEQQQICIDNSNRKISTDSFQSVDSTTVPPPQQSSQPAQIIENHLQQQMRLPPPQTSIEISAPPLCDQQQQQHSTRLHQTVVQVSTDESVPQTQQQLQQQAQMWSATVIQPLQTSVTSNPTLDQVVFEVPAATSNQNCAIVDTVTGSVVTPALPVEHIDHSEHNSQVK